MTQTLILNQKAQYQLLKPVLNERQWRIYLGSEARKYGSGGISAIAQLSGANRGTVARGVDDSQEPSSNRIRLPGGGRKNKVDQQPEIKDELKTIIHQAGDPMKHIVWTHLSIDKITAVLQTRGYNVGKNVVNRLLWKEGYKLRKNRKELHKKSHPDRDAQFRYIDHLADKYIHSDNMVASIDAKKTEKIGNFKNDGSIYAKPGEASKVEDHDFGNKHTDGVQKGQVIKAIPFGIYDIHLNKGFVNVGTDHNTSELAVESIRRWYTKAGQANYPKAKHLMLTADSGGANGNRTRQWKWELQQLANETGLSIHVCHYPSGTSKWNKIEHKLFSFISQNWQGVPLTSYEIVLGLIEGTATKTGLSVSAELDTGIYELRKRPTDEQMASINLKPHDFHPEWNYSIYPQSA
jgi:transposase